MDTIMIKKGARAAASALLALAMVLAASPFALADDGAGTVTVEFTIDGHEVTDLYATYGIEDGDTVYDVIDDHYAADWDVYDGLHYLQSLTLSGVSYASEGYVADPGCFEYDASTGLYVYKGGDTTLDKYNSEADVCAYGGIYTPWVGEGYEGYYYLADMEHSVYIGSDWTYQVDFAADGYGNPVTPIDPATADEEYPDEYTMDQCVLSDGDVVCLTYKESHVVF